MKKVTILMLGIFIIASIYAFYRFYAHSLSYGAPPYVEEEAAPEQYFGRFGDLSKWVRPEGPLRVGLQAGHYKNSELPDELIKLRESGGGTSNGTVAEWEVNVSIAEETKKLLEARGIVVDILPATIPPGYYADAVVAIHADGNLSPAASGFKVSPPRRDMSGKARQLSDSIEKIYKEQTKLAIDPNISRNMTGYYAFSHRRFIHSTHPMAPAVILETGFLTNPRDAKMLINTPEIPATALADALFEFLEVPKRGT